MGTKLFGYILCISFTCFCTGLHIPEYSHETTEDVPHKRILVNTYVDGKSVHQDTKLETENYRKSNFCENIGKNACPGKCKIDVKANVEYCECGEKEYFNYRSQKCEKIDFCLLMECKLENGICEESECRCKFGIEYDENKTKCLTSDRCFPGDEAIKNCSDKGAVCEPNNNTDSGYECKCLSGYEMVDSVCKGKCQLKKYNKECYENNKICYVDEEGKAGCKCPGKLLIAENNTSPCVIATYSYKLTLPLDRKASWTDNVINIGLIESKVRASMRSLINAKYQLQVLSFGYEIRDGKPGDTMDANILITSFENIEPYINLIRAPSSCISQNENDTTCVMGGGLVLRKEELNSSFPIEPDLCDKSYGLCGAHTMCNKTEDRYECVCEDGFEVETYMFHKEKNFTRRYCKEIDVCSGVVGSCPEESSSCVNNKGQFYCKCKAGYRFGDNITKEEDNKKGCIKLCSPNPCKNGQCEVTGPHTFYCRCNAGIKGNLCDQEDTLLTKARRETVIVGAVLGTFLGLTFIILLITLKKKNTMQNRPLLGQRKT